MKSQAFRTLMSLKYKILKSTTIHKTIKLLSIELLSMEDKSELNRIYYMTHRDELLERSKERQSANYLDDQKRLKIKESQRKYYLANREEIIRKARLRKTLNT